MDWRMNLFRDCTGGRLVFYLFYSCLCFSNVFLYLVLVTNQGLTFHDRETLRAKLHDQSNMRLYKSCTYRLEIVMYLFQFHLWSVVLTA